MVECNGHSDATDLNLLEFGDFGVSNACAAAGAAVIDELYGVVDAHYLAASVYRAMMCEEASTGPKPKADDGSKARDSGAKEKAKPNRGVSRQRD